MMKVKHDVGETYLRYMVLEARQGSESILNGKPLRELLINEGEVDSKVTVGRGNNQMGKEQNKADIAKETDKAEKAKEDEKVRVHGSIGDRDA